MQLSGIEIGKGSVIDGVLAQATNFLVKVAAVYPNAFLHTLADDPRLINIIRLGLVELGHKKIQERIAHFCRQLVN